MAAGGEQQARQLQRVRCKHVVVSEAVHEHEGPRQVSSQGQQAAAVVRRGIRVWMTQVTLGVACVVQPPLGDGRACDCSMEHVRHFEDGEGGEVAAEGPTDDAHSSRVDVCRVEVSQRGDGSGLVLERRRREVVVHAAVPHGPTSWGTTAVGDGDDESQVGNVPAWW